METFQDGSGYMWTMMTLASKTVILLLAVGLLLKVYTRYTIGVCLCTAKMEGKTVIVTGGNSGIGKETAKELARRKARVILACRNLGKAEQAAREIHEETGQRVVVKHLDLASYKSVRNFVADIVKTEDRLDVLINNAGMINSGEKIQLTEDACELCFQSNYLSHFLLTALLTGLLKKSAPSRVINVSSDLQYFGSIRNLRERALGTHNPRSPMLVYSDTKLAQVVFTRWLARQLVRHGITVNAVHPGIVDTGIADNSGGLVARTIQRVVYLYRKTSKEGAQTSILLAVDPTLADVTGAFFADCKRRTLNLSSCNQEEERTVARMTASIVGLQESELKDFQL